MITLTDRLRKLVNPKRRGKGRLPVADDRSIIDAGRGVGLRQLLEGEGGIASPLVEQLRQRTYYDPRYIRSSDGLFVIVYTPLESTVFQDGNGNFVTVSYTDELAPVIPEPTP